MIGGDVDVRKDDDIITGLKPRGILIDGDDTANSFVSKHRIAV
jgi:hypothetical protein